MNDHSSNQPIICDDCKNAPATTYLFVGSNGRRKLDLCERCADARTEERNAEFNQRDVAILGGDPSL